MSYVTDPVSGNSRSDALVERGLCHFKELSGLLVHFPHRESVGRITVVALVQSPAVHRNDVTFLEHVIRRETVHDDIIHRHTESRRETIITEETRNSSVVTDKGLCHPIQL